MFNNPASYPCYLKYLPADSSLCRFSPTRRSLEHHAAYLILAHNHPSGLPQPSEADKLLTAHICKALALIDIPVIDHIIVGNQIATPSQQMDYYRERLLFSMVSGISCSLVLLKVSNNYHERLEIET